MIAASLMLAVFVAIFARAGYEAYRDKRSDDACVGALGVGSGRPPAPAPGTAIIARARATGTAVERKQRRIGTHARLGGGEIARRR